MVPPTQVKRRPCSWSLGAKGSTRLSVARGDGPHDGTGRVIAITLAFISNEVALAGVFVSVTS